MLQKGLITRFSIAAVLAAVLGFSGGFSGSAYAQKSTLSDAQVQSNVLRAMAAQSSLANQHIDAATVFGTVTLSGSVATEADRDLADKIVSHTEGVKKVVDQLAVGESAATASAAGERASSVIPPPAPPESTQPPADVTPEQQAEAQGQQEPENQPENQNEPESANGPQNYSQGQQQYEGQQPPPPRRRLYRRDYERQLAERNRGGEEQSGGMAVTVPAGTPVPVRLDHWLSSGRVQPGTNFDGFIANDVVADGHIALPRGATVQGTVLDVKQPGKLTGSGSMTLQLQSVTLGGKTYPMVSDPWTVNGHDKTGHTVGNTAILGLFGALIGGAAGGGPGALAGAGIGSAAGLGVSAASGGGQAMIPGEAVVTFRLNDPANVVTVGEAEMQRLGAYAGPAPDYRRRGYGPRYGYPPVTVGVWGGYPYYYYRPYRYPYRHYRRY